MVRISLFSPMDETTLQAGTVNLKFDTSGNMKYDKIS